jgi:predicted nucleic acid-binding protein
LIVDAFLDTNVLFYAATAKRSDPEKYARALKILAESEFGTSAQVLSEFFTSVTRKGAVPMPRKEAAAWVHRLCQKPCHAVDADTVIAAIDLSERYRISYWDGAIIAAAERLGAKTLYTEDLNHGQAYGSVTAINPFL